MHYQSAVSSFRALIREPMQDSIENALNSAKDYLWGWPLIIFLVGTHIFLTIRLKFPQRYVFKAIGLYFAKEDKNKGDISQFSSLMIALAASVGTGNIIGVATAVSIGGPGAVFWCWFTGIFGMATRYGEGLLAVKYRVRTSTGQMAGGPMYVLERGLNMKWLGIVFAIFTAVAAFGIGNVTQGNSAATYVFESWGIAPTYTGIALTALTALVMLGGLKSIAATCAMLVPFMALFYILGCGTLLVINYDFVWPAIRIIMQDAFSGQAAAGGLVGAGLIQAIRMGVSRGLFSNEAGLGSAPIAAAASRTENPVRQALVSSTGPFWDTVIICAMTGLVLVSSIMAHPDISASDGERLTFLAFAQIPYIGESILTLSLLTFVISTLVGWSYFGEKALEYMGGHKAILPYRILWVVIVYIGCTTKNGIVWNFADCANALMAIPNLVALLLLSGIIVKETRHYLWNNKLDEIDMTPVPVDKDK